MKKKDYYSILGVSRSESANGIKAAFRKLAKTHHPDVAGFGKTGKFQEITEAYCVLINPEERRHYNNFLDEARPRQDEAVEPKNHASLGGNEALRRRSALSSRSFHPAEETDDCFWQDLWQSFAERGRFPRSRQERLWPRPDVEVILTQEEASRGGSLAVPFLHLCPRCEGKGFSLFSFCSNCGGRGMIYSGKNVQVQIPPHVEDQTVLSITIRDRHTSKTSLQVLIRVQN